ncbi:hypothetical protein ASC94_27640 [Massilia sp. Root418]|jgi:hypothetical protein|uniref:FAD-binding protein n=1 Tax=Massilia sp. Root418 TaxID=1736532 RepID=UPI0006F5DDA8|nr:FAD-binding protein [Massilia sp. Root418]KQW87184.1 hypothetical protein ASC94_27640 [Massilia sp. Root418]
MSYSPSAAAGIMPEKDTLSLLALKVAPNVFDLSSGQQHVSIRDQIIRAQMLVRDLCEADPRHLQILVVGAGIAGVTAALEASAQGQTVVVADTEKEAFSLQRGAPQRFVGPFMYEWPSSFFDDQSYPPRNSSDWGPASPITPAWSSKKPLSGTALAAQLVSWLDGVKGNPALVSALYPLWKAPQWWMEATAASVAAAVKRFAAQTGAATQRRIDGVGGGHVEPCEIHLRRAGSIDTRHFMPDYILLGAGLGEENVALPQLLIAAPGSKPVEGPRFWGADNLLDAGTPDRNIGIFGGGDGALQDALRALTGLGHPLEMIWKMEKDAEVSRLLLKARERLLAMEQQSRLIATWTAGQGAYAGLDRACRALAVSLCRKPAMRRALLACLRKGSGVVSQFVRESHFGKTYLLNRFLMHLLIACRARAGRAEWRGRMDYECHFGAEAAHSLAPLSGYRFRTDLKPLAALYENATCGADIPSAGRSYDFHEVAVRFGITRGTTPGSQMVTLSGKGLTTRTSLARIPVPFVLPR